LQGLGLDAFGPWHYKGLTSKNLIKVKAKRKTTNKKRDGVQGSRRRCTERKYWLCYNL